MRPTVYRNNWIPSVFNDLFDTDFLPRTSATTPAINVKESDDDYTVEVAAPGLKKDDFTINIDQEGNLHIKMESKSETKEGGKKEHYLRREFSYSKFEQTLILPDDVAKEQIAARMSDGVLTIDLPKQKKAEPQVGRQIVVD